VAVLDRPSRGQLYIKMAVSPDVHVRFLCSSARFNCLGLGPYYEGHLAIRFGAPRTASELSNEEFLNECAGLQSVCPSE
jgi:hypothetical protein